MNEQTAQKNSSGAIIAFTLLLAIVYAVLRYHIVGTVPWKDFSFFILNKGLCLAAFILLTMNFAIGPLNNLGRTGVRGLAQRAQSDGHDWISAGADPRADELSVV